VRRAAAGWPRLPTARILRLLDDSELAEEAAANPVHPLERMREIVEAVETGNLSSRQNLGVP
jgi:hypothetical protein